MIACEICERIYDDPPPSRDPSERGDLHADCPKGHEAMNLEQCSSCKRLLGYRTTDGWIGVDLLACADCIKAWQGNSEPAKVVE